MNDLLLLSQANTAPVGSAHETAEDRSTAFRPVEAGNEMQSGERLLVEAYAVVWIILFAFVWMSWRRQARIDKRIDTLEHAIAAARAKSEKAS